MENFLDTFSGYPRLYLLALVHRFAVFTVHNKAISDALSSSEILLGLSDAISNIKNSSAPSGSNNESILPIYVYEEGVMAQCGISWSGTLQNTIEKFIAYRKVFSQIICE